MKPKILLSGSTEYIDVQTGEVTPVEKVKYRNQDNYVPGEFDKDYETPVGESLTVPDRSFTIKEILEKYTRGTLPAIQMEGKGEENLDFDDLTAMDISGADIVDVEQELIEVKSRIEASKSAGKKAKETGGKSEASDDGATKPVA